MTLEEFADYLVDLCRTGLVDGSTPVMVTNGDEFAYADPTTRTLKFSSVNGACNRRTLVISAGAFPDCSVSRHL